MIHSDTVTLIEMADRSIEKAKQITPEIWAKKLVSLL